MMIETTEIKSKEQVYRELLERVVKEWKVPCSYLDYATKVAATIDDIEEALAPQPTTLPEAIATLNALTVQASMFCSNMAVPDGLDKAIIKAEKLIEHYRATQ